MGGFMGLLLGASVLTVFELFDLVLFNFVKKLQRRQLERRQTRRLSRLSETNQTPVKSPKIITTPPPANGTSGYDDNIKSPTVNFSPRDSYYNYDE